MTMNLNKPMSWEDFKHLPAGMQTEYLQHITDAKPITARCCIKTVRELAKYKPELKTKIIHALQNADLSAYKDSMQPLIRRDIEEVLAEL